MPLTPDDEYAIYQTINFRDHEWTPEATAAVEAIVQREADALRARVAAGLEVLAEHRRMCNPAPYTSERALAERMEAALAHATPSDAPQCWCPNRHDGHRHDFMAGRGVGLCGNSPVPAPVADRDAVRLSEDERSDAACRVAREHEDVPWGCACGAKFGDSIDRRWHLINQTIAVVERILAARLAHDAPRDQGESDG